MATNLANRLKRARAELYGLGDVERAIEERKVNPTGDAKLNAHNLEVRNTLRNRYGMAATTAMLKHGRAPIKKRWWDHVEKVLTDGH